MVLTFGQMLLKSEISFFVSLNSGFLVIMDLFILINYIAIIFLTKFLPCLFKLIHFLTPYFLGRIYCKYFIGCKICEQMLLYY